MAKKLFGCKDMNECHKKLEEILASGEHPRASCRENPNDLVHPYYIMDDNDDPPHPGLHLAAPSPSSTKLSEEEIDEIVARLAKKLKGES